MHTTDHRRVNNVEASFSKAAPHYAQTAYIQKHVAEFLAGTIAQHVPSPTHITELGAGTGFLTKKLLQAYPLAYITAIDISLSMLKELAQQLTQEEYQRTHLSHCDMDTLAITNVSLLCSSLALHWSKNPLLHIRNSIQSLAPFGFCAHAIPLKGSFQSLIDRNHFQPIPQIQYSMEQLLGAVQDCNICWATTLKIEQSFPSPLYALKHIKAFGGNISSAPSKPLLALRKDTAPIICEWEIGCFIAQRNI